MKISEVSSERYQVVLRKISDGSEQVLRFYILVVSTLIAGFGLISNSTVVVIGAMLAATYMAPIFSISTALVRSESDLFGRDARGVIVAVSAAYAIIN